MSDVITMFTVYVIYHCHFQAVEKSIYLCTHFKHKDLSIIARLDLLSRSTTYIHVSVLRCSTYGRPRQLLLHCSTTYIHVGVP